MSSIAPGVRVGPYEVLAQLGAGGMGEVYRAQDSRLARSIALKVIRRALVGDEAALDRLLREYTLASARNHPNIVTIYETGVFGTDRSAARPPKASRSRVPSPSAVRSPRHWRSRTRRRSSIATSSPKT